MILNVIRARLDEIFDTMKKQLIIPGFNLTSRINLLIVGEGSNLFNIEKYFANFFGPSLKRIGKDKDLEKNFVSCLGAIKIIKDGWETEAIPEIGGKTAEKVGFFTKFFRIER